VNRWHAPNKKSDGKAKKAKSKENPATSSASKRLGFSTPRTDTLHKKELAVDDLPNLDYAPLEFTYGKDLLLNWILCDCPSFMQRMYNWYKRACRLGLKTIYAPHHPDVFGIKAQGVFDITIDFADI
jgi:hypothetical protein